MRTKIGVSASLVLLSVAASAHALPSTVVYGFDGPNDAGWTMTGLGDNVFIEQVEATTGNPPPSLTNLVSGVLPSLHTSNMNTVFTTDYANWPVTALGIDVKATLPSSRPLSLMLVSDNGTAADPSDDWAAYKVSSQLLTNTWQSYTFLIPNTESSLPIGWATIALGANAPIEGDRDFGDLMLAVSQVRFAIGDPGAINTNDLMVLSWDNIRITVPTPAALALLALGGVVRRRRRG